MASRSGSIASVFALLAVVCGAGAPDPVAATSAVAAGAAAPSCHPRLQVFFAADFKDEAYQKKAYQKAASAWTRPKESPKPGGKAVVIVTIGSDGKTSEPVLHFKSGSEAWDAAALAALKKAAPFDPLPKSAARGVVEVHFHFECAAG